MSTDSRTGGTEYRTVLGTRVDATCYDEAISQIVEWSSERKHRAVHVLTVHSVMEAHDDQAFAEVLRGGDLCVPDGVPLVWSLRLLGVDGASRVYGPELTPRLLDVAAREGIPVGFYGGSSEEALNYLVDVVEQRYQGIQVAYAWSPPFRPLTEEEDARVREDILSSGARILFVGLGCPKQERWMADHSNLPVTMAGVGAAFDFLAGIKKQAPAVLQNAGLEWLFRLVTEPRRLWKRYLKHNPRFVALLIAQLLRNGGRA